MNEKDIAAIRRRFRPGKNAIGRVRGCYVNENKKIISEFDTMLGMISGTLIMATVGSAMNAFVLIPAYVEIYQLPLEQIISMGNAVNKYVNSLGTLVFFAVVPFNLIKGIIVSFLTALLYKRISPLLKNKGVVKTAR